MTDKLKIQHCQLKHVGNRPIHVVWIKIEKPKFYNQNLDLQLSEFTPFHQTLSTQNNSKNTPSDSCSAASLLTAAPSSTGQRNKPVFLWERYGSNASCEVDPQWQCSWHSPTLHMDASPSKWN